MIKVPGLKIIRVYTDRKEQAEFSIPNKTTLLNILPTIGPEYLRNWKTFHYIA